MSELLDPALDRILEFCARDPVERVFIQDVAERGLGKFLGLATGDGSLEALCHIGANLVPSGTGCAAFADAAGRAGSRMLIGEERAVGELWAAVSHRLPPPREDRPGQPVYTMREPPPAGETGLRAATTADLEALLPACAAAHAEELGIDPLLRDEEGFRWRTRAQIEEGRSWVWLEDGAIRFKAEASAWTSAVVQIQQVWVDPDQRRHGYASRGLRDLIRLLLESTPIVTLFVRTDNAPAIALYESIGMHHALTYRSILFLRRAILVRHGESEFSARGALNGDPSVAGGLTSLGRAQARDLARRLRHEPIDLCCTSEFQRVQETADELVAGRDVPREVLPELNDPRYGDYEAAQLADFRAWAWTASSSALPGEGGESRLQIVERYVHAYRMILARPVETILVVTHSLPIAYALGARDGLEPGARVPLAELATSYPFTRDELESATDLLAAWVAQPTW